MSVDREAPGCSIPEPRIEELDPDNVEWDRRALDLTEIRLAAARAQLVRMGIIDAEGNLISDDLLADV